MIKVYTENDERKIKICFHNTFLFSPYVYKDKMSSNSFDKYLRFCENLRREHPFCLIPQFWEWLNTRSTEISVTSGCPQCSYNPANKNQECYIFSTRDIINITAFVEVGISLPKEEGEGVSLRSEQSFTDKSSSDVNETSSGKDLII